MLRKMAVLLLLLACWWSQPVAQAAFHPLLDSYTRNMLSDALDSAIAYCQVPGALMAVKDRDGNIAYFTKGLANLETGQGWEHDLYFRIGSVTKTFTATAILQLVDAGKVGLDDTLDKLMPGKVAGGSQITVRNLLEMRSGLDHYENNKELAAVVDKDPLRTYTPDEILSFANRVISPAGQTFDYNNLNYFLLPSIIEQCTGMDYGQAIQDMLITPLGLTHTAVPTTADMPSPYAHGYLKITDAGANGYGPSMAVDYSTRLSPSIFGGAGNIISIAGDMLLWLDDLVDGKAVSQSMHQAQFDAKAMEGKDNMYYGLGVGCIEGAWGHNGNVSGYYTTAIFRYLDYDIVIFANGQTPYSNQNSTAQEVFNQVRGSLDNYLIANNWY